MKRAHILSIPFLVMGLLGAASASAGDPTDPFSLGKGSYPAVGEEVWRFVAPQTPSSTTRAQVIGELREAQRLGQISTGEDAGRFVTPPASPANTRARVVAELREAQRLGLVTDGGKYPFSTPEQERLIALAGQRAIAETTMAKR
jgi:hypothetical protein